MSDQYAVSTAGAASSAIARPTMALRFVIANSWDRPRLQQLWIVEEVDGPCSQVWRDVPIQTTERNHE